MNVFLASRAFVLLLAITLLILLLASSTKAQKRLPATRTEIQLSFAPLVKKAAPAVVNIFTKKMVRGRPFSPLFDDPFFRRFFGDNFRRGHRQKKWQTSHGSGVIVKSNGTIVTNYHVIAGVDEIGVVLTDRREFDAKIVGSDERTDLAILKIDPGSQKLPFLTFRDSDNLEVGDIVLAIGNPFGVGQTVTSGIVSALARTQLGINDLNFFIQTDAAINPGNSGGALITLDGRLVGVNSAIWSKGGGSVGIGFAIPSNMVRSVLAGITSSGRIVRPWIGAEGQTVNSEIAATMGLKRPTGVLINKVYPRGPADRAGIQVGDVIFGINDREVNDQEGLKFRIATRPIGDSVKVNLMRQGRVRQVNFPIEAPPQTPKPNNTRLSGAHPLQGATVANLSPALADELGMSPLKTGVIIVATQPRRVASRLGFRPGDIIQTMNDTEVESVTHLKKLVIRHTGNWHIMYNRGGKVLSLVVGR